MSQTKLDPGYEFFVGGAVMHKFVLGIFIAIAPSVLGTAWMLWRASGVAKTPYNDQEPYR
jgi:hypothetical protein